MRTILKNYFNLPKLEFVNPLPFSNLKSFTTRNHKPKKILVHNPKFVKIIPTD